MSNKKPLVVIPPTGRVQLEALNDQQQIYLTALKSEAQVFATGKPGTGKTYMPTAYAADELIAKRIKKFLIFRPAVDAGESLGFLPGEIDEKMAPWVLPIFDVLEERLGRENARRLYTDGHIEVGTFQHMRGRTFKNCIILLDEAQNTNVLQMKMFLTRPGNEARVFVTGDISQSDIRGENGLAYALRLNEKKQIAPHIKLEKVERGGLCELWATAIEEDDKEKAGQ